MIKGIIFDLDGTLIQLPINYEKIQKNLKILFNTTDEFSPLIPTIVKKTDNDKEKLHNAFDMICNEELHATQNLLILDGVTELIKSLKNMKIPLFLVTMQCRKIIPVVLEKMNLELNSFKMILTRDESHTRLEQIKTILELNQKNPEEILVIGDRIHDIKSAEKAGCKSILVNRKIDGLENGIICIEKIKDLKIENFL